MNISNTNKNFKFYFHMNYKFSITCVDCWNILTFIYLNLHRHNDKKWTKHCFADLMKWNRNKITNVMNTFCIEFLSNLEDDPHKRKKHSNKCHKCVRQRVFEKCLPQKKMCMAISVSIMSQIYISKFYTFV